MTGQMRIVYHIGAHCTDEDRLVRCLLKNRAVLAQQGISIPAPTRYRRLLRDPSVDMMGASSFNDAQAQTLRQMVNGETEGRVVLSWHSFIGLAPEAARGGLYPQAGERLSAFTRIFPDAFAEFHLAIRNPATFLPTLRAKVLNKSPVDMLAGARPLACRWADTVARILHHNPTVPLTVWCDEDTPLVWAEVLQAVSGHATGTQLADTDELMAMLLTPEGLMRMRAYCAAHPPANISQRRRVATAFLERFAQQDQIDAEIEAPGWTQAMVDEITANYHADIALIRAMPGVRFIAA